MPYGDQFVTTETARQLAQLAAAMQRLDERISTLTDTVQRYHRELRSQREAALWRENQQLRGYEGSDAFIGES